MCSRSWCSRPCPRWRAYGCGRCCSRSPAIAAAVLFAVAAQLAFNAGLVLDVIYPLVALAFAIVGTLAVNYFTATLERERVRDIFSRFVPETVVDDVLEGRRRGPAARRRRAGVHADVHRPARLHVVLGAPARRTRVIEVVNVYLGEMSEAILENGGTLIAYLGDGIMALFGAPIERRAPRRPRARRGAGDDRARGSSASTNGCASRASATGCGWGSASTPAR